MKILIIRHADPDNDNNTLTNIGFEEAKVLSDYLKDYHFDEVYTSDYARAKLTCDEVMKYHDNEVNIVSWLREFDTRVCIPNGQENNMTWDIYPDYYTKLDDFYDKDKYLDLPFLKDVKEKYQEVINKFDEVLEKNGYQRDGMVYKVKKENTKTIVLFCHFGVMCVLMSHLMNIPYSLLACTTCCPPTGITTFITEERKEGIAGYRMNGFGDVSHLRMANMQPSFHARFCEIFHSNDRH